MGAPTLAYGDTTVTLPYPSADGSTTRTLDEQKVTRRTVDGTLRTSVFYRSYTYVLSFLYATRAEYDAIAGLWASASAAGDYPSFDFTALWPTADGVRVGVDLGALSACADAADLWNFTLSLAEVDPR